MAKAYDMWLGLLKQCILDAQNLGEIDSKADVDQAVFEIQAMIFAANFLFVMADDPVRLIQARRGVERVLAKLIVKAKSKRR